MSQRRADKNARRRRRRARSHGPRHLHLVGQHEQGATGTIPGELDGPGSIPAMIRAACTDPHPIALLSEVSSVMSAADPRLGDRLSPREAPELALGELVEAFLHVGVWETDVLCRVVAHLTTDAGLARRVRLGMTGRAETGPAWLRRLDEVTVTGAYLSTDPLRDADDVLLEMSFPDGHTACLVSLVDHNLGGAVKDCFPIPASASYYVDAVESSQEGHYLTVRPLGLADAHAMLTPAIAHSLRLWPRPESDSWPGTLPLLEHLVGQLPAGGEGYPEPASEEEQEALVEDLLDSDLWQWERDGHEADAADLLVWLHNGFLSLGPARVSPATVELVMVDLWERKSATLSPRARRALPDVLRAFTRLVHRRQGIPEELTRETLDTIDNRAPQLLSVLDGGVRAPTVADLVSERLRLESERVALVRDLLEQQLGSADAVARLDDTPLPDERFDWSVVPANLTPRVKRLLEQAEPVALDIAGVELRTVLRRLVAKLAANFPEILASGHREDRQAAALLWVAGSMNGLLGPRAGTTVAEMLAAFGLTGTVADRGRAVLRALGWEDLPDAQYRLIHPDLLISERRRDLVQLREFYLGEG